MKTYKELFKMLQVTPIAYCRGNEVLGELINLPTQLNANQSDKFRVVTYDGTEEYTILKTFLTNDTEYRVKAKDRNVFIFSRGDIVPGMTALTLREVIKVLKKKS